VSVVVPPAGTIAELAEKLLMMGKTADTEL